LRKLFLPLLLLLFAGSALAQASPFCDVRAYGAKGDGSTLDTPGVNNAITACMKLGGGTIYFPPGRYVVGTIQLFSHLHLLLDSGAVVMASHDIRQYLPNSTFGFSYHYGVDLTGEGTLLGMFVAKNAEDITIDGPGEIDGQGDAFMVFKTAHGGLDYDSHFVRNPEKFEAAMATTEYGPVEPNHRPGTMIVFYHCVNIRVHGVTLRGAPNWTLHFQDVEGGSISDIQILNNVRIPNNDGIDCMMCRHVRIANCNIETGDDGFAIVGSEHVNVSNCSIASRSAAIRLESTKLSTFTGISMDANRGIAVFANGYPGQENRATEDVTFSDIVIRTRLISGHWWGKAEPIYIAVQPCSTGLPCGVRVKNVIFSNITAEAENGVLLIGGEGSPIAGVELRGVRLHMLTPPAAMAEGVGGNLDLRWTSTRPQDGIVKSEIPALMARKVDGLQLRDVQVDWASSLPDYYSEGIRVEDFKDLTIDGFAGRQAHVASGSAIALQNGSGVSVTNSRAASGTQTFLQLENVQQRRVFVNYDIRSAAKFIVPSSQRFDTQIGIPVTSHASVTHNANDTAKRPKP